MILWSIFLMFILIQVNHGAVTQMPSHACAGEDITVNCDLSVPDPNNNNFRTNFIEFIVGSSDVSITDFEVNTDTGVHGAVDLTRLTAFANNSFSGDKIIRGSITLSSYTASDASLRLGCAATYYLSGNTGATDVASETTLLRTAAPPSPAISLQSSISNFNTSTCSADISLSWNTPPSDRTVDRYFLYLDGSPLATTDSNSSIHSTILNINTYYQYSVTAMSCAGNSTNSSSNVNSFANYSLMKNSQYECFAYDNVTGALTVNWGLSTPTQPSGVSGLDITYSLQLLYSHSRQGVTYTYTDSTSFTLPSSQLSYNTVLTAHNFTQLDGVETNITANLTIVEQCGQSFSGTAMECFFTSNNLPIPPTPEPTTISISTSIPSPTSSMTSLTVLPSTTFPIDSSNLSFILVIGGVLGFLVLVVTTTFIIIITVVCIFLSKKRRKESRDRKSSDRVKIEDNLEHNGNVYVNEMSHHNPTESTQGPYYTNMSALPTNQLSDVTPTQQEYPYYTQMSALPTQYLSENSPKENQGPYYTEMSALPTQQLSNQPSLYANLK